MDKQEITEAVIEALTRHRSIDAETHLDHHSFIELMMKREERRAELVQKFKTSFVGALAVAAFSGLSWLGYIVIEAVKHGK